MEGDLSLTNINRAMQVLEIHTKLEEETHNMQKVPLKDKEVAVLKEMCNVGVQLIMLLCNNKTSV